MNEIDRRIVEEDHVYGSADGLREAIGQIKMTRAEPRTRALAQKDPDVDIAGRPGVPARSAPEEVGRSELVLRHVRTHRRSDCLEVHAFSLKYIRPSRTPRPARPEWRVALGLGCPIAKPRTG